MNIFDARKRIKVFVISACILLCYLLLTKWLHFNLFVGTDTTDLGWENRSILGTFYLTFSSCLHVVLWCFTVYLLAGKFPRIFNLGLLTVLLIIIITGIQLDMRWYELSHKHADLNEIYKFFFEAESWEKHYGISSKRIFSFIVRFSISALIIFLLYLVVKNTEFVIKFETFLSKKSNIKVKNIGILIILLVILDIGLVGYAKANNYRQWITVSERNPFRLTGIVDNLTKILFQNKEYASLNRIYQIERNKHIDKSNLSNTINELSYTEKRYTPHNVLVIVVEGFNPHHVDQHSMPFLSSLKEHSITSNNHYSTGNCTEYGVIGITHGRPPYFFKGNFTLPWKKIPGWKKDNVQQSDYIKLLNNAGYRTRVISWNLTDWADLGHYMENFSEDHFESSDDWLLIPEITKQLSHEDKQFIFTYYGGTHFPYIHDGIYTKFKPEVPEDFDYFSWDLHSYRKSIINRYRNCLWELDNWLNQLISRIDLEKTVLVITGDHGEEMFENGLLSHASSIQGPQIETPLVIVSPGNSALVINQPTSHIDIMPSILDLLNLEPGFESLGKSLVNSEGRRIAIAAMSNRPEAPEKWAIISSDYKVYLSFDRQLGFRIEGLEDLHANGNSTISTSNFRTMIIPEILRYERLFSLKSLE